jgi:hypothetical protein
MSGGKFVQITCVALALVLLAGVLTRAADDNDASKPKDKSAKPAKAEAPGKLYRFKSSKQVGKGTTQQTQLVLEDLLSGKTETLVAAEGVSDSLKEIEPDTAVEVKTEKHKVVSVAKADIVPGEDRPGMYVLVEWDKQKTDRGKRVMGVKLKKLGHEITCIIPLSKRPGTDDWAAPGSVEDTLGKVQPGGILEAKIKPGNPPIVQDLVLYRPPERGKFIKFEEHEMESGTIAAAFKMLEGDGITVTVTLPGTEKMQGAKKVLVPDPRMLAAVKQVKPDSEVEITLQPGDQYILREIKVIKVPGASSKETAKKPEK